MGLIGGGAIGGSLITPASRGGGIPVGNTIEGADFAAFAGDAVGSQGSAATSWPAYRGTNPTLTEPPFLTTVSGQVALQFGLTASAKRRVTLPAALGTACVAAQSAEIFLVFRVTSTPSGLWMMGGSGGADTYALLAGSTYDGAFSTARKAPWVFTPGLNTMCCLHVASKNGIHESRINGTVTATSATNTFDATGALILGSTNVDRTFLGDLFGVVVFAGIGADAPARSARRLQVQSQLTTRYGLAFTG